MFNLLVRMSMQINLQHQNVSCVYVRRSVRPSWCPSEFQNSAAQSCFFCRTGGENKRCLLPRRAADAEVIASH